MSKEKNKGTVEHFLIHEKIPLLIRELYATANLQQKGVQRDARLLASEINSLLDQVYGEKASYHPHYRITTTEPYTVEQFFPFIENKNKYRAVDTLGSFAQSGNISFSLDTTEDYFKKQEEPPNSPETFFDSSVALAHLDDTEMYDDFDEHENFEDDDDDTEFEIEYLYDEAGENVPGNLVVAWDRSVQKGHIRVEFDLYDGKPLHVFILTFTNQNIIFLQDFTRNITAQGSDVTALFSYEDFMNGLVIPIVPGRPDRLVDPRLN